MCLESQEMLPLTQESPHKDKLLTATQLFELCLCHYNQMPTPPISQHRAKPTQAIPQNDNKRSLSHLSITISHLPNKNPFSCLCHVIAINGRNRKSTVDVLQEHASQCMEEHVRIEKMSLE
ncbi:hypothetical protein NPIL_597421 [Nephila pilipes]|uniref:Uncharacterized protein n=1 Tax=Nephila pilipes TaxID=299642 RepID=A0A8X6Q1A9_NEPPI|nr:hypothetical protein NPIL_597421 [Nephila pilipes]